MPIPSYWEKTKKKSQHLNLESKGFDLLHLTDCNTESMIFYYAVLYDMKQDHILYNNFIMLNVLEISEQHFFTSKSRKTWVNLQETFPLNHLNRNNKFYGILFKI